MCLKFTQLKKSLALLYSLCLSTHLAHISDDIFPINKSINNWKTSTKRSKNGKIKENNICGNCLSAVILVSKGQCYKIFQLVFFHQTVPLGPNSHTSEWFLLFILFVQLFWWFTGLNDTSAATPGRDAFPVSEWFISDNDAAEEFLAGLNETSKLVLHRCQ